MDPFDDDPLELPARPNDDAFDDDFIDLPAAPPPALTGKALVKEVCRLIRAARSHWDAHHNAATRLVRSRALRLYMTMSKEEKDQVPQVLRVWLRYRSEKYYGARKKKKKKPR